MAEPRSALEACLTPGRFGAEASVGITLSEVTAFSMLQLSAWPHSLQALAREAACIAASDTAPLPGLAIEGGNGTLMRIEPLKWWLLSRSAVAEPTSVAAENGAVLDLSSSRTWITLRGPQAADLLNRFLPLNLSDRAFPPGAVASTAFHHVGVTLWRDRDGFNLLLPRSFAATLWEMLTASAAQFGYEVV